MKCPCYEQDKLCDECSKTKVRLSEEERLKILQAIEKASDLLEDLKKNNKEKGEGFQAALKNAEYYAEKVKQAFAGATRIEPKPTLKTVHKAPSVDKEEVECQCYKQEDPCERCAKKRMKSYITTVAMRIVIDVLLFSAYILVFFILRRNMDMAFNHALHFYCGYRVVSYLFDL